MRGRATIAGLLGLLLATCDPGRARGDDELDRHLATLRAQVDDPSLGIERRAQIAMEIAATLDRAAQSAPTADGRRARWTEAIQLLDRFRKQNPDEPPILMHQLQLQSDIYLWARGRSWSQHWERAPDDLEARGHAVENFDVAIARLRTLVESLREGDDILAQNARFRLAQALVDRAELDPEDSKARKASEEEARAALARPIREPELQGFAHLLRGEVLSRLGDLKGAEEELAAAPRGTHPPPALDLLEARVTLRLAQRQYEKALREIDASAVGADAKAWLAVRVLLAQRGSLPSGRERSALETALFERVRPLRGSSAPEARLAMVALARSLKEPDASQGPDAWDALAEASLALGDQGRAAALEARGADRAEALGQAERASGLRLRAGALLYQQGKFLEADALLGRVVEDPKARSERPKAGLLRLLARGRALALRLPGSSQSAYLAALEAQVRDFPGDPSANEARWLLGKYRLANSERDAALTLWGAIPRDDPRWLGARLAVARLRQDDVDTQRISNEPALVRKRYETARSFLEDTDAECRTAPERAAVDLALARLELTPDVGRAEEARRLCEDVLHSATQVEQRDEARRLKIVALAETNRFVEAEQAARAEVHKSRPGELLETARLLDHVASESESDLKMRRFGLILRIFLSRILEHPDDLSPEELSEARLRQTRALVLSGDQERARMSLGAWSGSTPTTGDRLLKDLADTYARLDAYDLAADVQRLRSQRATTGSPTWFEARYGLALAYYRAGKANEARKLIDATAILHPDLGGGALKERFVRLRQRLGPGE